jgi:hypothetical protein
MSDVTRYIPIFTEWRGLEMSEHAEGPFVLHDDYAALRAKCEAINLDATRIANENAQLRMTLADVREALAPALAALRHWEGESLVAHVSNPNDDACPEEFHAFWCAAEMALPKIDALVPA